MKKSLLILVSIVIVTSTLLVYACAPAAPAPTPAPAPSPTPAPAPAPAPAPIQLKFANFQPPAHQLHVAMILPWASEIEKRTGGRVKVSVYANASLLNANEMYDGVIKGVADVGFTVASYFPGRFPLTEIADLPFLNFNPVVAAKTTMALMDKYFAKEHSSVKLVSIGSSGQFHMFLAKGQAKTQADLKGLRIRSPGAIQDKTITNLGAVPITMPGPDQAIAFERGTIDGSLMPYSSAITFGVLDFTKWVTEIGYTSSALITIMNKDVWNKMPQDIQKIISDVSYETLIAGEQTYLDQDKPAKDKFVAKGTQIYVLPASELERWKQAAIPIWNEWITEKEAKGLPARQLVQDYLAERAKIESGK